MAVSLIKSSLVSSLVLATHCSQTTARGLLTEWCFGRRAGSASILELVFGDSAGKALKDTTTTQWDSEQTLTLTRFCKLQFMAMSE